MKAAVLVAGLGLAAIMASRAGAASLQSAPAGDAPADPGAVPDAVPADNWPASGYNSPDLEAANVRAFLGAIAAAEGTAAGPNDGYDVLFGWPAPGRTFDANGATDHPRRLFPFTDKTGKTAQSSAAGRYQFNAPTYDDLRRRYDIPAGFTPDIQDQLAITKLQDLGALEHVKAGRLAAALQAARKGWASLPGAGYNQAERSYQYLAQAFIAAGGAIV